MTFDCFLFFNEFDLLDVRLHELSGVVDYFVLAEATRTHSFVPKPLYFEENKSKLSSKFLDRIRHVVIDDYSGVDPSVYFAVENYHRKCLQRGVHDCHHDDLILLSDCDEIPRSQAVREASINQGIGVFRQIMSYYWVDCRCRDPWHGTRAMRFHHLNDQFNFQSLRNSRDDCDYEIESGGWHFSYLGGPQAIREKLQSFGHTDLNHLPFTDLDYIEGQMKIGVDLFGRDQKFEFYNGVDYPWYLIQNAGRFSHLFRH